MKYVKQLGKTLVLPVVFLFIFNVFGNTIVFADNVGDKCGAGGKGICRYPSSVNDGCDPDKERKSGECSSYSVQLNCCVPKETPPADNSDCLNLQCGNAHGQCFPNSCGDLEEKGTCTGTPPGGGKNVCCLPKNCAATNPNSSGAAASLNYTPLENLPGFEGESGDFATYFKNLYLLALWIVGISALFMLVVGGFLYLSSAGNTSLVGTAKKTIYGALIGLVIALISWLLLDTINSDLTNLKLSGLSGAVGTGGGGNGGGGSSGGGSVPDEYKGKGSGCSGAETQGAKTHCEDASQDLSDTLYCMVEKLKANNNKKIQISSISDDSGGKSIFMKCRDNWSQPPCEHGKGSCHYGGSAKKDKSCAADISGSYINGGGGAASASEVKDVAGKCGAQINDEMGKTSGPHIHISVKGCGCL